MSDKNVIRCIVAGVGALLVIGMVAVNCYTVDTGEAAIVSTFGKVSRVDEEGLHVKIPFVQSKEFMETREKSYIFGKTTEMDTTLEVSTKDMQSILIEVMVQASVVDPEKLYRAFRNKHEFRFVRPRVKEVVQATISKYSIEEFISKREEISMIINREVMEDLAVYGMNVNTVSLINHDFSDEYERAVEAKKVAEQAVGRARAEQEKLLVEQENRVKVAELELKEREIKARANKVEALTLTDSLLRKLAIEKWDGKLPQVQGSGSLPMLDLKK